MGLIDDLLEKEKKASHDPKTPPPITKSNRIKDSLIVLALSALTLLIIFIVIITFHQAKQVEPNIKSHAALQPPPSTQKILSTSIATKLVSPNGALKSKLATQNKSPLLASSLYHQSKEQQLIHLLEHSSGPETTIKLYEILTKMYFKSAKQLLTTGLKKFPQSLPLNFLKAQLQIKQGQLTQALNTLRTFKPNLINHPEYYGLMAKLHLQQKQHHLAQMLYQQLVNLQPTQAKWWLGLGLAFEQQNKIPRAQKAFQYARKLENKNSEIKSFLDKKITKHSPSKPHVLTNK